jgi:hypothetical protein
VPSYLQNDQDNWETKEEMPEEQINDTSEAFIKKDIAPKEEKVPQDLETHHSVVASSAVSHIKRNARYPPNKIMTRGSIIRDTQLVEYDCIPKVRQRYEERHEACAICAGR